MMLLFWFTIGHYDCAAQEDCRLHFRRVDTEVGLDFEHVSPFTEKRHFHLTMGSGVGWIDVNNDDWPDLFCCQGLPWTGSILGDGHSNQLFINRRGVFEPASAAFTAEHSLYSAGITTADFNNDGFTDLYAAGFLGSRLYRNLGDGTFERVEDVESAAQGLQGTSCAWGDFDTDGDLDLYLATYLDIQIDDYPLCKHTFEGHSVYIPCPPRNQMATHDLILRNNADGTFTNTSAEAGLHNVVGSPGMGIVVADLDLDHDLDIYVANDAFPNHLWVNDGTGNFTEAGLLSGTALNRRGLREAGMGVAVGDCNGNGLFDILVTNYFNETNTFYRNEGTLFFLDVTDEIGIGAPTLPRLAFGTNLADFNNDGWLDLFVANGHVYDRLAELGKNSEPFAQKAQIFCNDKGVRYHDASQEAGDYFQQLVVARSSAVADFNHDGRTDIAVLHLNGRLALLQNESPGSTKQLCVKLVGTSSDRSAVGAIVRTDFGNQTVTRTCVANSSYMAADEAFVTLPKEETTMPQRISVTWLNGQQESWIVNDDGDETVRLIQGRGMQP